MTSKKYAHAEGNTLSNILRSNFIVKIREVIEHVKKC